MTGIELLPSDYLFMVVLGLAWLFALTFSVALIRLVWSAGTWFTRRR